MERVNKNFRMYYPATMSNQAIGDIPIGFIDLMILTRGCTNVGTYYD